MQRRNEDSETEDEKFRIQLHKQLRDQRRDTANKVGEFSVMRQNMICRVNDDLSPVEKAYENFHLYEIRLKTWKEQVVRLADALRECEESCFNATQEIEKWRQTFEFQLKEQNRDALTRLLEVQRKYETQGLVEEDRATILHEMNEIKEKINRLRGLAAYKTLVRSGTELDPEFAPKRTPEFLSKFICNSDECGRSKTDPNHPLCRNCQLKLKEGKIHGNWARIKIPEASPDSAGDGA